MSDFWQPPAPPQNQLMPQQLPGLFSAVKDYQAKNALQGIYSQAIDPTTGAFNQGQFNMLLRNSPAAWNAGPEMQQSGQANFAQGQGTEQQLAVAHQQMSYMTGLVTPLLQQKGPITRSQVQPIWDNALATGGVTPQQYAMVNKVFDSAGDGDLRPMLQSQQWAMQNAKTQIESQYPSYAQQDYGGQRYNIQQNPMQPGYGTASGPGLPPVTMAPSEAATVVDIKMSDGTTRQVQLGNVGTFLNRNPGSQVASGPHAVPGGVTNEQFGPNAGRYNKGGGQGQGGGPGPQIGTTPQGQPITATPSAGVQQQGQVTSQNLPPPQGTPGGQGGPPAVLPTNIPAPTTIGGQQQVATNAGPSASPLYAQPPARGPAPVAGVSPSAGEVASIGQVASAATGAYNTLQAQVTSSKNQVPIIDNMISNLNVKGWAPGFGSTVLGTVRQLMQRAGISPTEPSAGFDVSNAQQAQEEFAKNAGQLAAQQLTVTGNATDARQELAESTNPGMLLSRYGNQGILHMLKGTQLAIQAEGQAWQKAQDAGWLPGSNVQNNFNTWQTERFLAPDPQTGGRFDPRTFWVGSMPKFADQQKYLQTMDPDEQVQFRRNMQYAVDQGWLSIRRDGSVRATVGQ